MKLGLYANDLGPGQNLAMIASAAIQRGHGVIFAGNTGLRETTTGTEFATADVLVTGLSSFKNELELALGKIVRLTDRPWVIVGDTYRATLRPAAKGHTGNAHAIVAERSEAPRAIGFGYNDAHFLGNPPVWRTFLDDKPAEMPEIQKGRKIVLVAGGKNPLLLDLTIKKVVEACREILGPDWALVLKPHPNEDKETASPNRRRAALQGMATTDCTDSTRRIMLAADVSILPIGGTDSIAAAFRRKAAICLEDSKAKERLRTMTGSSEWFPTAVGACLSADMGTLGAQIQRVLHGEAEQDIRKAQEKHYPLPKPEDPPTEERIVDYLEEIKTSL